MFVRAGPHNTNDPLDETLHPWVRWALQSDHAWKPNPDQPVVLAYEGGELKSIADSEFGPELVAGDIVWMSMTVSYHVGTREWRPEIRLYEIIRVGRTANPQASNVDATNFPKIERHVLSLGKIQPSSCKYYTSYRSLFSFMTNTVSLDQFGADDDAGSDGADRGGHDKDDEGEQSVYH